MKTAATHFAMKFGDHTVFVDRDLQFEDPAGKPAWNFTYYIDGAARDVANTPMEVGDLYFENNNRGKGHIRYGDKGPQERTSCFEYGNVAMWLSWSMWVGDSNTPFDNWALADIVGSPDFLDPMFGQCGLNGGPCGRMRCPGNPPQRVQPEEMLITKVQHDKVCKDLQLSDEECDDTSPPPPPATKEEMCEANSVDISHAKELCADQQSHGSDIYDGCVYDVCATEKPEDQLNAVEGVALAENVMNPEAQCLIGDACRPCDLCARTSATPVDLSNVVQNNLGGLGPDDGAEEVRYNNAIDLNGKKLDVVLTVEGGYSAKKPQKNGYADGGFGRITMQPKSSTDFKLTFVDATTGQLVSVPDLALTFYDLDQGKNGNQQERISVCGAKEVYTTSDTELDHQSSGVCNTLTSTTRGTGKDNPRQANDITKMQAARSATFEFHSRASISFSAGILKKGKAPRNIMFSFESAVACGSSDGENQCVA